MNLDEQLREALRNRAALAPDGRGLLTGVNRHVRRLGRRRNAAAAGAAGFVVAASVAASMAAVPVALEPDPRPGLTSAATPDRLVRADYELPAVPLEPGWLPPRFDRRALVKQWNQGIQAAYQDNGNMLIVRVQTVPRDFLFQGEDSQTTINGVPARMRVGSIPTGRRFGLIFERDGLRIEILGYGDNLDVAQVKRFAEELRPGRVQASVGFRVTLVPQGFVQSGLDMAAVDRQPTTLCFHGPVHVSEVLCFELGTVATPTARPGTSPTQRPRFACTRDSVHVICASTNVPEENLSQEDLTRMARGVELTG